MTTREPHQSSLPRRFHLCGHQDLFSVAQPTISLPRVFWMGLTIGNFLVRIIFRYTIQGRCTWIEQNEQVFEPTAPSASVGLQRHPASALSKQRGSLLTPPHVAALPRCTMLFHLHQGLWGRRGAISFNQAPLLHIPTTTTTICSNKI